MTSERGAIHCVVRGRVQGVGFRAFVRDVAESLEVSGWVRNSADPREVELVAQGTPASLAALRRRVEKGPSGARVESLSCEEAAVVEDLDGFEIRR